MGEVYLADDVDLLRQVAVKVLPATMASSPDWMRRFRQEAHAAAGLNHPNIATIHEIGESGGISYIAMEFIDGATLREKIHVERAPLGQLLRHLQHVAEGLAKAHAAGIVHRDLKPDNIMISPDGHAKIVDFGIAKLLGSPFMPDRDAGEVVTSLTPQHSLPGTMMGTVGYMSPEQAQGNTGEIDQRSDVFSFGCILFEAATRHRAFEGRDAIESLNKILREPAPPIADFNPSAPAALQRIVQRCVSKDPDGRYQSIKDVAIELKELRRGLDDATDTASPAAGTSGAATSGEARAGTMLFRFAPGKRAVAVIAALVAIAGLAGFGLYWGAGTHAAAITSIAVMPFVNESGSADVEYLSDGMTDTLIARLSQLPNLAVKARASVFRYKGKATDVRTIGKELDAQAIVNGRVVQRGDQLVVTLELVDARTENVIWAERYDRRSTDLVSLPGEIARRVVGTLQTKLSRADELKLAKTYTANPEAYRLHLQGRFLLDRTTREDTEKGMSYLRDALALDPGFALCWAELARAYAVEAGKAWIPEAQGFERAREATKRALSLDPDLAEGHALLGRIAITHDLNLRQAEASYRRAMELAPQSAPVVDGAAALFYKLGRFDEALALGRRATVLDPLSSAFYHNLGLTALAAGLLPGAEDAFKRALELAPQRIVSHALLATVLMDEGRIAEATAEATREPDEVWRLWALAIVGHRAGRKTDADEAVRMLTGKYAEGNAFQIAEIWAERNEAARAFEWLERAYEQRDSGVTHAMVDPRLRSLHADPRWRPYLQKLGFKPPT